ncbi:MAG: hypothetical protein ABSB33_14595, partial [Tepidisphaeraceae bacterium]
MREKWKIASILVAAAGMASPAFGATSGTISYFENTVGSTTTPASTFDPTPTSTPAIITAILSKPGTFNGKTYTSYAIFANDGTGSADVFGKLPTGSTYTPTVGDDVSGVTGTWSPYQQIPELESMTSISANSSGNPVPAIGTTTIPLLNVATLSYSIAGYLLDLDNVTITGQTAGEKFGITNIALTVTDTLGNSMELYYWPTSYSAANVNLFGETIPTGPVDISGFGSVYTPAVGAAEPEFNPISMVSVPEPVSAGLLTVSG